VKRSRRRILRTAALALLLSGGTEPASAAGEVLWTDVFDQSLGVDQANDVATKGRRVVVAGRSDSANGTELGQSTLRALDAKTGESLWSHQLEHVQTSNSIALAISGNRAFVALEAENADGTFSGPDWMVAAHDLKTGAPLWEDILPSAGEESVAALAVKGSRVFAGGEPENLVDPASGRDWLVRAVSAKSRSFLWEDRVDSALATDRVVGLAVSGRRVIAAGISNDAAEPESSGDWLVRALDAKKGTLLWQNVVDRGGADTVRDVGVSGRTTVVVGRSVEAAGPGGDDDWLVQAYDTKTGALLWEDAVDYALGEDQPRRVAVGKKQVVVIGGATNAVGPSTGEDLAVRAYDSKTGALLWEDLFDGPSENDRAEQVAIAGKAVLVAGRSQRLVDPESGNDWVVRAYDVQTGALLWSDAYDGALGNDRVSTDAGGLAVSRKQAFVAGRSRNVVDPESRRDATVRAYGLE
jgi:outer membrane protein assembly factor BamB